MVYQEMLQPKTIDKAATLEKEEHQENYSKTSFNFTYHFVLKDIKCGLKKLHIILTSNWV